MDGPSRFGMCVDHSFLALRWNEITLTAKVMTRAVYGVA